MMYKHKNLRQLLCCVLLLCLCFGSSAALFSVNADQGAMVPANLYAVYPELTAGILNGSIIVTTSAWNLVSTDVDYEYLYNYTEKTIKSWAYNEQTGTVGNTSGVANNVIYNSGGGVLGYTGTMQKWNIYERDMFVNVVLTNLTSSPVSLSSAYPIVSIQAPKGHSFRDISVSNSLNLGLRYATNYSFVLELGEGHYTPSGVPCLRPGEHVSITIQVKQCTYTTSNETSQSGNVQLPPNDYPTAANIDNITGNIANIDPNILVDYNTSVLSGELLNIISALNGEQNSVMSSIQDQTQQQEQQHNELIAHSDTDDSSNINGAISSGTDAVKDKMGLFSFFDGIVTSMSDILTSDHERNLVLPALDVPLPEETVHIWDRKEFDFDELENHFGALLTVVRFATVAACYSVMISGAYNIFHKFIGVKDGDA